MTNEVIKRPSSEPVTIANNANQALYKNFREWREYASSLEEDVKNLSERVIELDEHSQDEKDAIKKEYDIHQEIYSKTSRKLNKAELEIVNLKSQLQQQALPVVPECVGNYIEECKENRYALNIALDLMVKEYASRKTELSTWVMNNQEQFAKAWFGKYEVEKPKMYYLKHIDMSETNEHYDYYSTKNQDGSLNHVGIEKRWTPKTLDYTCKFTQLEIDSMQTGSYEQIEVTE